MSLLHEIEFAGKEVIQVNQFRIALDDFVGSLLKWQTDIKPEAVLAARATLRCAHDSVASPRNNHIVMRDHFPPEILRYLVIRRIR